MPILLLRVEAEGGKDDCCYLDLEHVRTTDSLLQNVHQLAWDLLPGACQIQATYADDEGDHCTLTEQTAKDALSFATPHEGIDDTVLLTVIVRGVWAQEVQVQNPATAPTEVLAARRFDGTWRMRGSGFQHVISGETVTFADGQIGKLRVTGASSAELELKGASLTAELEAGGNILWSDGQIWSQPDLEPECETGIVTSEMCQAGCGKPTWNKAPGFCGSKCKAAGPLVHQARAAASEMCQAGCGKPTWNKAPGFCGSKCKAEERDGEVVQDATDVAGAPNDVDADAGRQAASEEHHSSARLQDMEQKVEGLREELGEAMCQREQLRQQCDLFKVQLARAEEQVGPAIASGDLAREKFAKLTVEVDELKVQQTNADRQCSEHIEALKHKVRELEQVQTRTKEQRDVLKRDLTQVQKQYGDEVEAMRDAAVASGNVGQEDSSKLMAELDEAKLHAESAERRCQEKTNRLLAVEQSVETLNARHATDVSTLQGQMTTASEEATHRCEELDKARQQLALGEQQGVDTTEALKQKLQELETLKSELGQRETYCSDLERQLEEIEHKHGEDSKAWMDVVAEVRSKLANAESQSAERARALQDMEQTVSTLREGNAAEVEGAKMELEEAQQHHEEQVHEIQEVGASNLQKAEEQGEQFQRQLAEAEKQHGDVCARWGEEVKAKTVAAAASGHIAQQLTEDLHDMQRQLKSALQVCEERAEALQDKTQALQQAECKAETAQSSLNTLKNAVTTPTYSASVLLLKDSPLTLGIEAEEDDSARGDVTKELEDVVASYGARAAFRIGRMRLPATFSEVAPACARVAVQNDGPSRWPPTTVIVNVEGDNLGLQVMALGVLEPGEVREIEMDLEVGSKSKASSHSQKRLYRPRHAMPQLAPRFVLGEARAESRSLWAILDAATGERLGPLLVFEAVWDLL